MNKIVWGYNESCLKYGAVHPGRESSKCISTTDKLSLVGRDIAGRNPVIQEEKKIVRLEFGANSGRG
jgi:hypothetical protein